MIASGSADDAPVCVIGAGPCGLAVAIALQKAGFRAIVFDRTCVCSSIASYPTYVTFFSTAERLEIGGMPFPFAGDKPTRRDALAYYRMTVSHFRLDVRQFESVERIEKDGSAFIVHSRPRGMPPVVTRARAIVVATGYFGTPNMLGVPGEDLPHVTHLYRDGHEAFQRHAVVVGGGNSAVESAVDLWRYGAKVTLVHFGETFDKNIKPWVYPDFENRVKDGAIAVRWNSRVVAIEPAHVVLDSPAGRAKIPAQQVYLLTGFTPHPGLLLSLGVPMDESTGIPAHDPATMETPAPGVFVAGVLTSGFDANKVFIENGRGHGSLIAAALAASA